MRVKKNNSLKSFPLESVEQQHVFAWARMCEGRWPVLKWLVHVPNGGLRNMPEAVRFKAEGVRRGFPDIILCAPRRGFTGLAIEMKRQKGAQSRVSTEQKDWLEFLGSEGWCGNVCYGADEAIALIEWYVSEKTGAAEKVGG